MKKSEIIIKAILALEEDVVLVSEGMLTERQNYSNMVEFNSIYTMFLFHILGCRNYLYKSEIASKIYLNNRLSGVKSSEEYDIDYDALTEKDIMVIMEFKEKVDTAVDMYDAIMEHFEEE